MPKDLPPPLDVATSHTSDYLLLRSWMAVIEGNLDNLSRVCAACIQAFCRVAAVAGATYVLRHPVSTILLDPTTRCCVGVRTGAGQILSCDALAADAVSLAGLDHIAASIENSASITSADEPCRAPVKRSIARAVCIIDGPLQVKLCHIAMIDIHR